MDAQAAVELARRLQRLRVRWGFSQAQLATALGVSRASVVRWEQGRVRPTRSAWARLRAFEAHGTEPAPDAAAATPPPVDARRMQLSSQSSQGVGIPAAVNAFVGRGS